MEIEFKNIALAKNPLITLKVASGHFATTGSHFNRYLDMSELKSSSEKAEMVARELAIPYLTTTLIDTIVCMEGTEVIAAYMAKELTHGGTAVINSDSDIFITTPHRSSGGKLIFQDNEKEVISGKSIILLVASVAGGRTIDKAVECIDYYGGKIVGISSLYAAVPENYTHDINTVFTGNDIQGYNTFPPDDCEFCKEGLKLDAIVTSEGYKKV